MDKIIGAFADTPIPTILVVAGILFLLLSVAEKVSGHLTIPEARKKQALGLGVVLLSVGVFLSVSTAEDPTSLASSDLPSSKVQSLSDVAAIDWEEATWSGMKPEHRALWEKLGHTAETWAETAPAPATENTDFNDLLPDQKKAAEMLGYTAVKWNKE